MNANNPTPRLNSRGETIAQAGARRLAEYDRIVRRAGLPTPADDGETCALMSGQAYIPTRPIGTDPNS